MNEYVITLRQHTGPNFKAPHPSNTGDLDVGLANVRALYLNNTGFPREKDHVAKNSNKSRKQIFHFRCPWSRKDLGLKITRSQVQSPQGLEVNGFFWKTYSSQGAEIRKATSFVNSAGKVSKCLCPSDACLSALNCRPLTAYRVWPTSSQSSPLLQAQLKYSRLWRQVHRGVSGG